MPAYLYAIQSSTQVEAHWNLSEEDLAQHEIEKLNVYEQDQYAVVDIICHSDAAYAFCDQHHSDLQNQLDNA